MPYIQTRTNISVSPEQRENIKRRLGEAASIIGKSESWLMTEIVDNCKMYFRGDDTNFNGANFLTINLNTTILDLSTFKAEFILGDIAQTFDDISSGSISINLTSRKYFKSRRVI